MSKTTRKSKKIQDAAMKHMLQNKHHCIHMHILKLREYKHYIATSLENCNKTDADLTQVA